MAKPTPQQLAQAIRAFGNPATLRDKLPTGPLKYDTSGGMTMPGFPTNVGRNVTTTGDWNLGGTSNLYWPTVGTARDASGFPSADRLPPGRPVAANPPGSFSPYQVAGMGTDLEGNRSAYIPLPRRRPTSPAVAAIDGAAPRYPGAMLPSVGPRMAQTRRSSDIIDVAADLSPTGAQNTANSMGKPVRVAGKVYQPMPQYAPQGKQQAPGQPGYQLGDGLVSLMTGGKSNGPDGLFNMLFGGRGQQSGTPTQPQRSPPIPLPRAALSRSPAVAAFQQQGMTPSQAHAAAAAPAYRPTNAAERSQARQDAAEAEYRALNNFSG